MKRTLKILSILFAWGCWLWAVHSQQWIWLPLSVIPYFLLMSFGHRVGDGGEE